MSDKLDDFIAGLAGACDLMSRASKNGFFIEYICLAAGVIDACLRMGLVLQHQIDSKSVSIPEELIFQMGKDYISEREIYRRAKDKGIISQQLFEKLKKLYDDRNIVIHRYIITQIKTDKVLEIGIEYEKILDEVNKHIYGLEKKQIELGVGMTRSDDDLPEDIKDQLKSEFQEKVHAKHGFLIAHVLKKSKPE